MTRPAAESWAMVGEILDRPPVPGVDGQLALVDDEPGIFWHPTPRPVQLGLFDPEVTA